MVIELGVTLKQRWELIGEVNQLAIQSIHGALRNVKANPEQYDNPVQLIEDMEFTLQGLWKFPRNVDYHVHWKEIKGCTCPKMDNEDPMYFGGGKITVSDCPWHWKKPMLGVVSISYRTESGDDYLCQFEGVESTEELVKLFVEQAGEELAYICKLDLCTNMGLELEMKIALSSKIEEAQQLEDGFYD